MGDHKNARIPVTEDTRDALKDRKRGDDTYEDVIRRLMDGVEYGPEDAIPPLEAIDPWSGSDPADAIEQALADAGSGLTYDDVKNACGAAIREELGPEGGMR